MELLFNHLKIAMSLGVIAVGVIQGLKEKGVFGFTGKYLVVASLLVEFLVASCVGYYYLGLDQVELIAVVVWTVIGAEAVYGLIKPAINPPEEDYFDEFEEL